jgi:hypothetical protein
LFVIRVLIAHREAVPIALTIAAVSLPAAAVFAWLLPIVRDTASHEPAFEELERALSLYADELDVFSVSSYRLAPEVFTRSGAIAVAALILLPLAALAARRRWASFVLGGSLAVVAVMLLPEIFAGLADFVSLSQARRAAGFLPFAFVFAGGIAVLTRLLGWVVLPVALAAGIGLQLAYPGDFSLRLDDGGPAFVTWFAAAAGTAALVYAIALRGGEPIEARGWLVAAAAALFVVPIGVHATQNWSASDNRNTNPLTTGLVLKLRSEIPAGDVVFSDLETSYRVAAAAPVYIAAAPPAHVADTAENRPYERREDVRAFFGRGASSGDLALPRRYGARWIVVDRDRFTPRFRLPAVYSDERYALYRIPIPSR